jgi:hypothetical protein
MQRHVVVGVGRLLSQVLAQPHSHRIQAPLQKSRLLLTSASSSISSTATVAPSHSERRAKSGLCCVASGPAQTERSLSTLQSPPTVRELEERLGPLSAAATVSPRLPALPAQQLALHLRLFFSWFYSFFGPACFECYTHSAVRCDSKGDPTAGAHDRHLGTQWCRQRCRHQAAPGCAARSPLCGDGNLQVARFGQACPSACLSVRPSACPQDLAKQLARWFKCGLPDQAHFSRRDL